MCLIFKAFLGIILIAGMVISPVKANDSLGDVAKSIIDGMTSQEDDSSDDSRENQEAD